MKRRLTQIDFADALVRAEETLTEAQGHRADVIG
jgi:hypothetical protein